MIFVKDILRICNGKLLCGNKELECINFTNDTRTLNKGDIFVGIKGESFNGNTFYKDAIKKGASACIIDDPSVIDKDIDGTTIILVEDSIKAIQALAKYKRSLYDIPVVAVTGSVGKTSVKDMVSAVIASHYKTLSTKGNMNNHIGLPFTILGLKDHEALVVEMGMNHLGEIHTLSDIAKPTLAIITNIGTAHIGNLGSRENILKAKMEITDGLSGALIINNDNDMLRNVKYNKLITIGIDNNSNYMAHDIKDNVFETDFYIGNDYINLPIGSRAFVYNALFAYATGEYLGIPKEKIINSLKNFKLTPHRLELISHKDYQIIDDTYNASLDSVNNALEMLSKVKGRKVFIFGDILELDDYAKDIHEEIGNIILKDKIDVVITVGKNSNYTYNICKEKIQSYHYDDNKNLLNEISGIIKPGDTILIKGSHGMNLIEIVNYLKLV